MKTLLAALLILTACDETSSPSSGSSANSPNWRSVECPSYRTTSGLFRISDPVAGNTVYLHIGKQESSMCVLPGSYGSGYKEIKCPYYGTNSGLFSTIDPDNGNTIYLHIGADESSIFVMPSVKK